jgi:4-diphosphocytidyl-2-C-methyl-D-erythritol kinase
MGVGAFFVFVKTLLKQSGCKINLLLNILRKRNDGFHELETVLQPVPLHDEIELSAVGSGVELTCDVAALPCDDSNLVVRAARGFFAAAAIAPGARMHLRKRIPMEAGLGGGSGNAAATLLGLNELFDGALDPGQLWQLAAKLGSDVPFFLQSGPALATGRGEVIEPLEPFPQLAGKSLVLLRPDFGVATAWAYQSLAGHSDALNGRPGRARELVHQLQSEGPTNWGRLLYNSLEAPVFLKYPILGIYTKTFRQEGALGALMSGSGSTVFAWFEQRGTAEDALGKIRSAFGTTGWSTILS